MTKNNDGRKHWGFGRIYEKEQAQLWNFLRKAWENFEATVLAKTVAAKLKIKKTATATKDSTFCTIWDKLTSTQPICVLKYGYSSIPIIPQLHSKQNQNYDAR